MTAILPAPLLHSLSRLLPSFIGTPDLFGFVFFPSIPCLPRERVESEKSASPDRARRPPTFALQLFTFHFPLSPDNTPHLVEHTKHFSTVEVPMFSRRCGGYLLAAAVAALSLVRAQA